MWATTIAHKEQKPTVFRTFLLCAHAATRYAILSHTIFFCLNIIQEYCQIQSVWEINARRITFKVEQHCQALKSYRLKKIIFSFRNIHPWIEHGVERHVPSHGASAHSTTLHREAVADTPVAQLASFRLVSSYYVLKSHDRQRCSMSICWTKDRRLGKELYAIELILLCEFRIFWISLLFFSFFVFVLLF